MHKIITPDGIPNTRNIFYNPGWPGKANAVYANIIIIPIIIMRVIMRSNLVDLGATLVLQTIRSVQWL